MHNQHPIALDEFIKRTGNVLIHLLNTCNLSCQHCYLDASSTKKVIIPVSLVKKTIKEISTMGFTSIQFTGGEPLLYPGIEELLRLADKSGLMVTLSTNAILINKHFQNIIAETKVNIVTSIDGPPHYHDPFRGTSGSFFMTEKVISDLIDKGIKVKVVMTVSKENLRYIEWCTRWAHLAGIHTILFQPLESIGRGKKLGALQLSQEQLHDLYIELQDLSVANRENDLKIKMTYESRDFMIKHPCRAFICNGKSCHRQVEKELKKIVIREDGTILPELVAINPKYSIGNLFQDSLENNLLHYLNHGYYEFDRLCRKVYHDTVLNYPSPLISWNEILTERSYTYDISKYVAGPVR